MDSLSVYNNLSYHLSQTVTDDHGINAVRHGPQVDHLLDRTVHLHLRFFIDLHPEAVINADGERFASNESFSISVYNSLGVKIYEETKVDVNGSIQKVIDLRPVPNGVYSVVVRNSLGQVVRKIIVNR